MDTGMRTYGDELVAVLSAATAVLSDLPARVHRLTGPDLDAVLPLVDRLAAVAAAGRFTITADAVDRGEVASSQAGSTAAVGRRPVPVPGRPRRRPGRQGGPRAHRPVRPRSGAAGVGVGGRSGGGAGGPAVGVRRLRGRLRAAAAGPAAGAGRGRRGRRRPGRDGGGRRRRRGPPGPAGHAGPVRPRPAAAGPRGPAPGADRPVLWARHRRRDHRVPDAAQPRSPSRRRSRHQRPVPPTTRHPTTRTGSATRADHRPTPRRRPRPGLPPRRRADPPR